MEIFNKNWSQISQIHETKIVKSIYVWLFIVPILVKTLGEIPAELNFHIAGQAIPIRAELPFSLLLFYLSAFLFALSNLLFQYHCPQLIRDHSSWRSFAEHGKGSEHLTDYVDKLKILDHLKEEAWSTRPTGMPGGPLQDCFWAFHKMGEWQTPKARKIATFFTYTAFLLMAWVVIQNLLTVINYGLNNLLE